MTSQSRAQALALAAAPFADFFGNLSEESLVDWLTSELGHANALDAFFPKGPILTKAIAPRHLLHIVSGNTPHAGLQSLLRGLLIGAQNTIKLPSSPVPEIEHFISVLPPDLSRLVTTTRELTDALVASADCIVAIGSDSAISSIYSRLTPHQRFIPHGHKISFSLVDSPSIDAARLAARDVSIYDQHGCLSPHAIYVKSGAADFAPLLADQMQAYENEHPRPTISISESGAITNLRETFRYLAANHPQYFSLYHSPHSTAWTVVYENSPTLSPSPLNRFIYVRPWPTDLSKLGSEIRFLSSISLHPLSSLIDDVELLSPPRICPLGSAQFPPLFWHHDGFQPLASLVTWRDIHPA